MPLIYSDREVNQRNNLRHKTVIAFLGLLSAEYVYASQESGRLPCFFYFQAQADIKSASINKRDLIAYERV